MNLLPKTHSQFKSKAYWDKFFQQARNFEWYGQFSDFKQPIFAAFNSLYNHNQKQKHFAVAHLGCGNSRLGEEIAKAYPMFDLRVDNYDYSEQVIAEMAGSETAQQLAGKVSYRVVDLLKPIPETTRGHFEMVIDKGTLDAILPEDKPENTASVKQYYFDNLRKLINKEKHCTVIIISMLQDFVLRTLLQSFVGDEHFTVNIHERWIPNSQMQPFFIQLNFSPQKHQVQPVSVHTLNNSSEKYSNIGQVLRKVSQIQHLTAYTKSIKQLHKGQLTKFSIMNPKTDKLRYMLEIVDNTQAKVLQKNTCAVFIVPQGQEQSQLFNSEEGLRGLQEQVETSRLIVVKLVSGQEFKSLDSIKEQLNMVLPDIIQKGCPPAKVPYLTDGSIGQRNYLYEDEELIIEQVLVRGEGYRRLILKSNPALVQSQFRLTYVPPTKQMKPDVIISKTLPHKPNFVVGIDLAQLVETHHRVALTALVRLGKSPFSQAKVLHLGGGACSLAKYIRHLSPETSQTIVQNHRGVIKSCSRFFEWPQPSASFEVVQEQALKFINSNKTPSTFSSIVLDLGGQSQEDEYPPALFYTQSFIFNSVSALQDGGVFVVILLEQENKRDWATLMNSNKELTMIYETRRDGYNIIAGVKQPPIIQNQQGATIVRLEDCLNRGQRLMPFEPQCADLLTMVHPREGQKFKESDWKVVVSAAAKLKKKKKKK